MTAIGAAQKALQKATLSAWQYAQAEVAGMGLSKKHAAELLDLKCRLASDGRLGAGKRGRAEQGDNDPAPPGDFHARSAVMLVRASLGRRLALPSTPVWAHSSLPSNARFSAPFVKPHSIIVSEYFQARSGRPGTDLPASSRKSAGGGNRRRRRLSLGPAAAFRRTPCAGKQEGR